jgi:hypothetical protein
MKIVLYIVLPLFIYNTNSLSLMAQNKPNPIQHSAGSKNGSNPDLITLGDGPNAPVAAAATNITTSSFVASWNTVSGATSYQLDVSSNNFTTYVTGYFSKELTVTSETISGLSAGANYRYRVRAVNTRGMSANSNTIVVSMLKQSQTITFPSLLDKTLGDAVFSLTATASSGLTVTYSTTSDKVTLNQNQVTLKKSGRVSIVANQAGDGTYDLAPAVTQSFCIKPTKPTVTVNNTAPNAPVLTSNAATGNQWVYNGEIITGAVGATHTATGMGVYRVNVMVDDCVNSSNDISVAVAPVAAASTAITSSGFNASWNSVTGSTSYLLDVSADNFSTFLSGYNGRELTTTTHTVTGLAPVKAYRYRVRAKNGSLTSANSNVISVTTSKENQTISFPALPERTLGDAPFALSATASSTLAVAFSTTSDKITISGSQVTITKAGRASIVANQAGNTVFNAAPAVTQSFCIKPAKPTVTVSNTLPNSPVLTSNAATGNQWFYNGAIINGAVNSTYTATRSGIYNVTVKVDDCISEFSNDVTATLLLNAPVAAAATAITTASFSASWSTEVGATSYLLDVSADNFVTFVNGYSGRELTTTSYTLTGLSAAQAYSYRVRAKNTSLTSANSNIVNVTTAKQDQAITFAALPDRTLGEAAFALTATASSNLSVTFSTTSPNITISTNQVELVKAGRTSIVANQAGNDVFNEAPVVTQSFCIKPLKPTVNITDAAPAAPVLTSNASVGNQWFLDGVAIEGATGTTHTAKKTGTYKVNVQVDDCLSAFSDDLVIVVVPIPAAPVAAPATDITTTSFLASWSPVEGATKYQLDVSADDFATFVGDFKSKEFTATSTVVEGLNAGSQYKYRVRAVNAGGVSNNSPAITVLTAAITGDVKIIEFTVSPNPIEDVFQVNGLKDGETNMQIIDMKGCVFPIFFERNGDSLTASTAHLVSGLYLLRIFYQNELIQLKLLKK